MLVIQTLNSNDSWTIDEHSNVGFDIILWTFDIRSSQLPCWFSSSPPLLHSCHMTISSLLAEPPQLPFSCSIVYFSVTITTLSLLLLSLLGTEFSSSLFPLLPHHSLFRWAENHYLLLFLTSASCRLIDMRFIFFLSRVKIITFCYNRCIVPFYFRRRVYGHF